MFREIEFGNYRRCTTTTFAVTGVYRIAARDDGGKFGSLAHPIVDAGTQG
jgi:hypothetical protein